MKRGFNRKASLAIAESLDAPLESVRVIINEKCLNNTLNRWKKCKKDG